MRLFSVTAKARGVSLAPNIKQNIGQTVLLSISSVTAWDGGADRDRTGDLLLAKQALSQLSYSPLKIGNWYLVIGN